MISYHPAKGREERGSRHHVQRNAYFVVQHITYSAISQSDFPKEASVRLILNPSSAAANAELGSDGKTTSATESGTVHL